MFAESKPRAGGGVENTSTEAIEKGETQFDAVLSAGVPSDSEH